MLVLDEKIEGTYKSDKKERIKEIVNAKMIMQDDFCIDEFWSTIEVIENELEMDFIRMDFGVPNIPPPKFFKEKHASIIEKTKIGTNYPPSQGLQKLRESISTFFNNQVGGKLEKNNVYVTCGATQALFVAQSAAKLLNSDKGCAVHISPTYPSMISQSKFLGLKVINVEIAQEGEWDLISDLEKIFSQNRVVTLCWSSPNNPTWSILSSSDLKSIACLCEKYGVVPIEDLTYLGMVSVGKNTLGKFPSISHYSKKYFIVLSASKMLSYAGERLGVLISSDETLDSFIDGKSVRRYCSSLIFNITAGAPHSGQYAFNDFIEKINDNKVNLNNFLCQYSVRSKILKEILKKYGFSVLYENSYKNDGFYVCFYYQNMSAIELTKELLYLGVAVLPLSVFESRDTKGVRACVGRLDNEKIMDLNLKLSCFSEGFKNELA